MGIFNIFNKGTNIKKLIKTASLFINTRDYDESIKVINEVINKEPDNYDALIVRARAYCYLENYDNAIIDLNKAINISSFYSSGFFFRGQINIIKENYYEALDDFNKVIKIDKRNYLAYLKKGSVYTKLGLYDAAVNSFKALVRIRRKDEKFYELFLATCFTARRYKELEKYSKKLIKINDQSPSGFYYLGIVEAFNENNKESIGFFTEAIRRSTNNPEFYYHRGMSYMFLGDYNNAIVDFTKSKIYIDREMGEIYFSRGYCYLRLNEFEKAIEDFENSIRLNYNVENSNHNKKLAYNNLKKYAKAVE